jgi:23S rRNA (cytosine1962-C5)-methyltransferase
LPNLATFNPPIFELLPSPEWQDYALLDSGSGEKLERYGPYTFQRPEPQAVWKRKLPEKRWNAADAVFVPTNEENGGHWSFHRQIDARWQMQYQGLRFWAQTSASRHLGVFPEQAVQWDFIAAACQSAPTPPKVLNLFGYTGLASLAAACAGGQVTHLDASKKSVSWGRENQELSGLTSQPIRWIVDDALKFVQREARRGARYDGLILDPPKFGRGPKGEVWEFYRLLPELLQACAEILSEQPVFMVLTAYAIQASALTIYNAAAEMMDGKAGALSTGELVSVDQSGGRILSHSIFVRWKSHALASTKVSSTRIAR